MKPNRSTLAAILPFLLVLNGCQGTDGIEAYDAPKDANLTAGPVAPDTRTLAAAIYRENATWFLKLMGPIDAVAPLEAPFQAVLRGIRFAGPDAPADHLALMKVEPLLDGRMDRVGDPALAFAQ
jgi:hypothetical protein